jgi:hypothetical protein
MAIHHPFVDRSDNSNEKAHILLLHPFHTNSLFSSIPSSSFCSLLIVDSTYDVSPLQKMQNLQTNFDKISDICNKFRKLFAEK